MKLAIAVFFSVLSFDVALAREATPVELARILINNPLKAMEGYPACNDNLISATASDAGPGVTVYELKLAPGGFCERMMATVSIVEDRTPQQTDRPIQYTAYLKVTDRE